MKISKSILGISGEYYVAAELGKRNIYAQLTLRNQKRTDLLIFVEDKNKLLKIEVKCKQGYEWPNCKGINQDNSFIVFVDFKDIKEDQRPDFYILSKDDWSRLVRKKEKEYNTRHPERVTKIEDNVLVFIDEVTKQGKPYMGCGVKCNDIESHLENWSKIINAL